MMIIKKLTTTMLIINPIHHYYTIIHTKCATHASNHAYTHIKHTQLCKGKEALLSRGHRFWLPRCSCIIFISIIF